MKQAIFIFSTLILFINTYAGEISFVGPCDETPLEIHQYQFQAGLSIGDVTIQTLEQHNIPYIGAKRGINSIFNTPIGMDAIEIINKSEMLAYGWCYSINGVEPFLFPSEVTVKENDHIVWWFGYAHYKHGEWIAQCLPAHERKSSLFCEQ